MAPTSPTFDRRADPLITPEFVNKLNQHIDDEEERTKADAVRQALDAKRFDDGAKTMKQLADDLSPLKKMYHAFVGCSALALALLAMGGWIYTNDRTDAKKDRDEMRLLSGALTDQSTAIKVILSRMQDFKEEQDRMRITLEKRK